MLSFIGHHRFTFTPLEFYSFPFAIVIVAHLGSLRADLGSVSASFRIVSVPQADLKVSLT